MVTIILYVKSQQETMCVFVCRIVVNCFILSSDISYGTLRKYINKRHKSIITIVPFLSTCEKYRFWLIYYYLIILINLLLFNNLI